MTRLVTVADLVALTIVGAFLCADEVWSGNLRVLALMAGALLVAIVLGAFELRP